MSGAMTGISNIVHTIFGGPLPDKALSTLTGGGMGGQRGLGTLNPLHHGTVQAPNTPALAPVPVMPLMDQAAVTAAQKKQSALAAVTGGRASTILTGNTSGDKLG